jgi:hypothetical protein
MSRRPDDEEPIVKIAARRAVRRLREDAETPEFGRLLVYQAASAAGDALIAIALAGSLFFSVPSTRSICFRSHSECSCCRAPRWL